MIAPIIISHPSLASGPGNKPSAISPSPALSPKTCEKRHTSGEAAEAIEGNTPARPAPALFFVA